MKKWIIGGAVVIVIALIIGSVVSVPGMDNENPLNDPDDEGPEGDIALGVKQVEVQVGSPELDQDPMAEKYTITTDVENELTVTQYIANTLGITDAGGSLSVSDTWDDSTWVVIRPLDNRVYWKTANISTVDKFTLNFTAETSDGYNLMIHRNQQSYLMSEVTGDRLEGVTKDNPLQDGTGSTFDSKMTSDGYTQNLELQDLDGAKLSLKFKVTATDEAGRTVSDDIVVNMSMDLEGSTLSMEVDSIE